MKTLAAIGVAGLALLCGCSSDIERVRTAEPTKGTAFTRALAEEYRVLAIFDADSSYNFDNANHFAHKALAAGDGLVVPPEELMHWHIPAERKEELTAARAQLLSWLDGGARDTTPEQAARAQVRFDCWLENADVPEHEKQMTFCRDEFHAAMGTES
jgi:OmpA-OmpF porin, OOP family